jgi:hypothetical protein
MLEKVLTQTRNVLWLLLVILPCLCYAIVLPSISRSFLFMKGCLTYNLENMIVLVMCLSLFVCP